MEDTEGILGCFSVLMSLALYIIKNAHSDYLKMLGGFLMFFFAKITVFQSSASAEMNFYSDLATKPGISSLGNTVTALMWCCSARLTRPQTPVSDVITPLLALELIYCVIA